ncbi:hypothetical protein MDG893_00985 [Marinobacter algicola DG893]|uniref:Uncharacterized protein n=1 Tax=Marinobacter algicola DG893 TaxID=443152 RepID=A6F5M7_9GAMM|nr:hypothetical protein MDG893_00985 [Marinobacter algicola DG893]
MFYLIRIMHGGLFDSFQLNETRYRSPGAKGLSADIFFFKYGSVFTYCTQYRQFFQIIQATGVSICKIVCITDTKTPANVRAFCVQVVAC